MNPEYCDPELPNYFPTITWNLGKIPDRVKGKPATMTLKRAKTGDVIVPDMEKSASYKVQNEEGGIFYGIPLLLSLHRKKSVMMIKGQMFGMEEIHCLAGQCHIVTGNMLPLDHSTIISSNHYL